MATSEESLRSATVLEQLLIARFLFREGVRAQESGFPYSPGLAVSLFQDAAELALAAIAIAVDAKVTERMAFMAYWETIENAPKNLPKKPVPSKAALTKLNAARVAFKHHGQRPQVEDVAKLRSDVEVFLRELASLFLGVDFDQISLTSLIADQAIREKILEAERFLGENKPTETLQCCAEAAYDLLQRAGKHLPPVDWTIRNIRGEPENLRNAIRHMADQLAMHRRVLLVLATGMGFQRYARFEQTVPVVRKTLGGAIQYSWRPTEPADATEQRTKSQFCIDFVVDLALRLQSL